MLVLFEPDELSPWPTGLEIYETLTTLKKRSVPRIEIEVHKPTRHYTPQPVGKIAIGQVCHTYGSQIGRTRW